MSELEFPQSTGDREECECTTKIPRRRTYANGSDAIFEQCPDCGRGGRALKKSLFTPEDIAAMGPWDDSFRLREMARYEQQREQFERAQLEREKAEKERRAKYNAYLATPEWRRRRLAVLKRDNWTCQGCLDAQAEQAHHLTYEHLENEFLWELVAVCLPCHRRLHPHMQ